MRNPWPFLALALFATPAAAQVTANLPVTCNAAGTSCVQATPVTNPDGTAIGGSSGPSSSQLPATLGPKTGALSLSVVPDTDTPFPITGAQAQGATVASNPMLNGCYASQAPPTAITAGKLAYGWCGLSGQTIVGSTLTITSADGAPKSALGLLVAGDASVVSGRYLGTYPFGYNGTLWDQTRTIQGSDGTGIGIVAMALAPQSAASGAITSCISASSAATSLICKASAGNYYDGYCKSSVVGNCILYNSATVPSAGALTAALVLECAPILTAGGVSSWAYPSMPRRASAGVVILFSSSTDCNTYTASSTAYIHGSAQ